MFRGAHLLEQLDWLDVELRDLIQQSPATGDALQRAAEIREVEMPLLEGEFDALPRWQRALGRALRSAYANVLGWPIASAISGRAHPDPDVRALVDRATRTNRREARAIVRATDAARDTLPPSHPLYEFGCAGQSWLGERARQCAWHAAGADDAAYAWSDAAIALVRVAEGDMDPGLALEVWQPLITSVPDLAVPERLRATPDRG